MNKYGKMESEKETLLWMDFPVDRFINIIKRNRNKIHCKVTDRDEYGILIELPWGKKDEIEGKDIVGWEERE